MVGDPIADRRQRAREAAQDSAQVVQSWALGAIEVAIETATQVKITEDIVKSAWGMIDPREMARVMFEAAGFEVIE